ncbi:MAG: class I SAM-dependent methyltransferase [Deltaproteobacteria bacterium]|nr:class I SAM-dependent methyltransferase [Deltaproteobacteria bacterium]
MNDSCHGKLLSERDGRRIIACDKCGHNHVVPMYTEEELENFYENVYSESTPSFLWHEKVENIKRFKKAGKVLDIGCWEGQQLEHFIKTGWKCVGTELNKRAANVAISKGIDVHQISIREFFHQFENEKWDVINVAYILEHIPDPIDLLIKLKGNLENDGIIIVEVPNDFSPFQLAYIAEHNIEPYWITLPDHLNYFDRKGIENLLKRAGFSIIHGETSFPMEMFLLMGDNYLHNRSIGKASFQKVVAMERILRNYDSTLVSELYASLYMCGVGRSIVLYVKSSDNK